MPFRLTTLASLTSGLIVAAGLSAGCQIQRGFRSAEVRSPQARLATPWRRAAPQPSVIDEPLESEEYVSQLRETTSLQDTQRSLAIPPQPEIPDVPAVEPEVPSPARRWAPARTNVSSESDDFGLPPARVIYNTESTTEAPLNEPVTAPPPIHTSTSQPRLFRPAGTTRNMFDSMKRKLSWTED